MTKKSCQYYDSETLYKNGPDSLDIVTGLVKNLVYKLTRECIDVIVYR